jgi:type I restriction enzyme S subunit
MEFKKKTELREISTGKIPEDWEVARLGNPRIAEIRGNRAIKGYERVAFIPMELVPDQGLYCEYEIRNVDQVKSATYCEVGDLLLAKITPSLENGKQGIVPSGIPNGFAFATTEVFPIVCKGIDTQYLFYILKFPKYRNKLIGSMIGTTGRQRTSKSAVDNLKVPLPNLKEQKKIAEILSTVDKAIEKVDQVIGKTKRLKKGLMQELLTKGIGHKEFKDTEVGRIPKEWKIVKLEEVSLNFINGGTPSTKNPAYWNGSIPWMTSAHINGRIITQGMRYITKKGLRNSATKVVPKNSILIATRVGIGKVAINLIDIAISQDLTGMVVNQRKINVDFAYWSLSNYSIKLRALAQGSTIKGLLRKEIEKLKIPLPPLPEQKKIAEILSTVDKRLELLKKKKEKLERVKKGLMNDLLTGRRRVSLLPLDGGG